jgi:hypothetical protein
MDVDCPYAQLSARAVVLHLQQEQAGLLQSRLYLDEHQLVSVICTALVHARIMFSVHGPDRLSLAALLMAMLLFGFLSASR